MDLDRRSLFAASGGLALTAGAAAAATRPSASMAAALGVNAAALGVEPSATVSQTRQLQRAIEIAAEGGLPLLLPPGRYLTGPLRLPRRVQIHGVAGASTLVSEAGDSVLVADGADLIALIDLDVAGRALTARPDAPAAIIRFDHVADLLVRGLRLRDVPGAGLRLTGCRGTIEGCVLEGIGDVAIHALDSRGLAIAGNRISDCGNNAIQVWRSRPGEDGTQVTANRIERVRAAAGGSGQNGNGVNVFRSAGVLVAHNRISDCAYSAVRGNAASNLQIIANSCERLGEVALYAEFGFQGAVIAQNLVDTAATGIAVTNFHQGGRLAVVQGNLVRNLLRREAEPVDKRGEGIFVEADATVTDNTVEAAATCGIAVGWHDHVRNVVVASNLVRASRLGIAVSAGTRPGGVVIAANLIEGARIGAIREMVGATPVGDDLAAAPDRSQRARLSGNVAL